MLTHTAIRGIILSRRDHVSQEKCFLFHQYDEIYAPKLQLSLAPPAIPCACMCTRAQQHDMSTIITNGNVEYMLYCHSSYFYVQRLVNTEHAGGGAAQHRQVAYMWRGSPRVGGEVMIA